jgi:hypothetical protein
MSRSCVLDKGSTILSPICNLPSQRNNPRRCQKRTTAIEWAFGNYPYTSYIPVEGAEQIDNEVWYIVEQEIRKVMNSRVR